MSILVHEAPKLKLMHKWMSFQAVLARLPDLASTGIHSYAPTGLPDMASTLSLAQCSAPLELEAAFTFLRLKWL